MPQTSEDLDTTGSFRPVTCKPWSGSRRARAPERGAVKSLEADERETGGEGSSRAGSKSVQIAGWNPTSPPHPLAVVVDQRLAVYRMPSPAPAYLRADVHIGQRRTFPLVTARPGEGGLLVKNFDLHPTHEIVSKRAHAVTFYSVRCCSRAVRRASTASSCACCVAITASRCCTVALSSWTTTSNSCTPRTTGTTSFS